MAFCLALMSKGMGNICLTSEGNNSIIIDGTFSVFEVDLSEYVLDLFIGIAASSISVLDGLFVGNNGIEHVLVFPLQGRGVLELLRRRPRLLPQHRRNSFP